MQGDGSSNHDYLHPKKRGGAGSFSADAERIKIASQYLQGVKQLKEAMALEKEAMHQGGKPPEVGYPYSKPEAGYPYKNPSAQAKGNGASGAQQAASAAKGAAGRARVDDARMLKDMFQAVFPDLGGVKLWGSATKVASMTGSLSLSVAFFGFVYYMSTRYDTAKEDKQQADADKA